MKNFDTFSSRTIQIDMKDIDTDIIIPAAYLKVTTKEGLGENVFHNLRKDNPNFPMDREEFKNARIVVAGPNFGCGSSREHAPWALKDAGIDVVISSEFADIFKGNAEKNGILLIKLEENIVNALLHPENELSEITINLAEQKVIDGKNEYTFDIPSFSKKRFLENISDLDYLLENAPDIRAFEKQRKEKIYL